MQTATDTVTLYYQEGASDKVYQASIEPAGNDLFSVTFAYGRRGSTLQTGVKTASPVPYDKAKAVFDKLVRSKTAKGYTPGADGTPYAGTEREACDTGIHCQLLNSIDENDLGRYLASADFMMQEKFDGRRLLVRKQAGSITGINRRGLETSLPGTIAECACSLPGEFIIDGEAVGETLHAFDLLEIDGFDLRGQPYRYRFGRLTLLLASHRARHIQAVDAASIPEEKRRMFSRLRDRHAEGGGFKDSNAPCASGRPNSGGSQLKFKFHKSASCLVAGRNSCKRSVSLALFSRNRLVGCGNVTIPPNHAVPDDGTVVEVRYLYAMPDSNALYQPVYLGARDDLMPRECVLDQLCYKAA